MPLIINVHVRAEQRAQTQIIETPQTKRIQHTISVQRESFLVYLICQSVRQLPPPSSERSQFQSKWLSSRLYQTIRCLHFSPRTMASRDKIIFPSSKLPVKSR